MTRELPSPSVLDRAGGREVWVEMQLEVTTWMFGGSTEPGKVDPHQPVRGPAIRGQLRHWWRVAYGNRCSTLQELYQAESRIFGCTKWRSPFDVEVQILNRGREERVVENRRTNVSYVLFPYEGDTKNGSKGVAFRLRLTRASHGRAREITSEEQTQLLHAVRLWIAFGGVGARTRRGLGSLRVRDGAYPASAEAFCRELQAWYARGPGALPVPTLSGSKLLIGQGRPDPVAAWEQAVHVLESFRQKKEAGRRSAWPEAKVIRRWVQEGVEPGPGSFPRADLGLPVVFHFPRERVQTASLQLGTTGATRMASPVIVKVLSLGRAHHPMVLLLNAPHPWELADHAELSWGDRGEGRKLPADTLRAPREVREEFWQHARETMDVLREVSLP